ncbi:hypothetical protein Unana1_03912 [Umbelopsis nana]
MNFTYLLVCLAWILSLVHARPDISNLCKEFRLVEPPGGKPEPQDSPVRTYVVDQALHVRWKYDGDFLNDFVAIELFKFQGLIEILWVGNVSITAGEVTVDLPYPRASAIPGNYFLRAWAASRQGPDCITYSKVFYVTDYRG